MNTRMYKWWSNFIQVSSSPNWNPVHQRISARLPKLVLRCSSESELFRRMLLAAIGLMTAARVVGHYRCGATGIASMAPSENNKKAIKRLEQLTDSKEFRLDRLSSPLTLISCGSSAFTRVLGVIFKRRFRSIFKIPIVKQLLFMQFLGSYITTQVLIRKSRPALAVVANDHSPIPCGFIAAADSIGLKLVYVQHAQVTASFPSLNFDLSLLYGPKSAEAYGIGGPAKGRIELIGSGAGPTSVSKTGEIRVPDNIQVIGVALTNLPPGSRLKEKLKRVSDFFDAAQIFVRPHPAFRRNLLGDLRGVASISDAPLCRDAIRADLFLCGNSSVALEILLYGTPVAFLRDLDNAKPDHYGFVKAGVIPELVIDSNRCNKEFIRRHYQGDWRKIAAQFDISFVERDDEIAPRVSMQLANLLNPQQSGAKIRFQQ